VAAGVRWRLDPSRGARGALAFGHANDPVTHTPGYTIASLKNGSKVGVCLNWCSSSSQQHGHSQAIAMKTPMTALLVAAVLVSGIATFASPTAAKRKHFYAYSSLTYGYRIGSPRWWRAMDRAGRGGRPGGI